VSSLTRAVGEAFGVQVGQMGGDDEHARERSLSCASEGAQEATMQVARMGAEGPSIRLSGGC